MATPEADPTTLTTWAVARSHWTDGKVLKGMQRMELFSPRGFLVRLVGYGELNGTTRHREGDAWVSLLLSPDEDVRIQYCHNVPSQTKAELGWLKTRQLLYRFVDLPKEQQFQSTQAIQEHLKKFEADRAAHMWVPRADYEILKKRVDDLEERLANQGGRYDRKGDLEDRITAAISVLLGKTPPAKTQEASQSEIAPPPKPSPPKTVREMQELLKNVPQPCVGPADPDGIGLVGAKTATTQKPTYGTKLLVPGTTLTESEIDKIVRMLQTSGIMTKAITPPNTEENFALQRELGIGWTRVMRAVAHMNSIGLVERLPDPSLRKGTGRVPTVYRWKQ